MAHANGGYLFNTLLLACSVLIPFFVSIFLFLLLKATNAIRINVAIALLLVTLSVYGVEAGLQIGLFTLGDRYGMGDAREGGDSRTRGQVIQSLRDNGHDAYPAVFPIALLRHKDDRTKSALGDLLPLGGVSNVTTVACNETGEYLVYRSDEFGFHNPSGLWGRKDIDIVAVGDSFAQGHCVPSHKNFIALIRQRYGGTLSLGNSGNGPLAMLAGIREYVPKLRPKVVLWFYYEENDVSEDLPIESRSPILMKYLDSEYSQHLMERQTEIDRRVKAWLVGMGRSMPRSVNPPPRVGEIGRFVLSDLVLLRTLRNALNVQVGPVRAYVSLFKDIVSEARKTVENSGGRLYLVNLPGKRRYMNMTGRLSQNLRRDRVFSALSELGVPIIDMVPVFEAQRNPHLLFVFHYTEEGNRLVASRVLKSLEGQLD